MGRVGDQTERDRQQPRTSTTVSARTVRDKQGCDEIEDTETTTTHGARRQTSIPAR